MAIVINTAAGNTSSINNEMLFVVYEATKANDETTYPNYKYVCDIYVDSVMVGRLKATPDPTYKRGIFNVAPVLQSYVTYGLNASSNKVDYTAKLAYRLKFGEEYSDTLYTNLTVDSTDREAFKTYAPKPFTSSAVITNGLISNMPSIVRYHEDELYHLIPYFRDSTGITSLSVEHFSSAAVSLGTNTVSNADYTAGQIRQANIGVNAWAKPAGTSYSVLSGAGVSLRVNYMCDAKYPAYTLAWLNPFGAYESQSFGMVSKKSIELSKKEFAQLNYRINSSGEVSYQANNVYYGGKKGYATTVKQKLNLTSHILNANEYEWLADLFISPDVYLFDGSKFIPVTISQNNYDYNTYLNNRLKPIQFSIEFADVYNSQFL